ncbi:MAG TPA: substrate-binding domain-containing protein [Anaerolineaceae bacterium]|nr:substrate-binding domain-containing protein [Anaerolineaceae bacterium]
MDETHLYQQIAESIRREIYQGTVKAGDRLPSVRQLTRRWNCTPGTVQRAYQELARQGLVTSRAGQGTHVTGLEPAALQNQIPLRRAGLVHRVESLLLEVLSSGYSTDEVEQAVNLALDRWRAVSARPDPSDPGTLRFNGSHDLVIPWLASHLKEVAPAASDYQMKIQFSGSLGGLIALAEGKADLAGCHLWDEESDTYNIPFVRRLLPGKRTALVALGQRRLGLILTAGNPLHVQGIPDLLNPGIRFANRQPGSGTRVWLDAHLRLAGVDPDRIQGYDCVKLTHSDVARSIAEGEANAGLGLEFCARAYGLSFHLLALERYDLVVPEPIFHNPLIQALVRWLASDEAAKILQEQGGYASGTSGEVTWVN